MGSLGGVAQLNSGTTIPLIGLGTASDKQNYDEIKGAVAAALEVGYRHFDTASLYGSEIALGDALKEAFQNGVVTRDEVFVTTKLWSEDLEDPVNALKTSLKNMQLEYVDLYLIHWPVHLRKGALLPVPREEDYLPLDMKSTWQGMEQCIELSLTKAIGVSNVSSKKIECLLSYAKIFPAVNQVEMHPMWQQRKLRDYCSTLNIHVSAWSPLGGSPTSQCAVSVMDHPVIKEIAEKHGKSTAQVGYRHFDTASLYNSERPLGKALHAAFQNGLVNRDDVFVTTKLWDTQHDDPVTAIKSSLKNLQLDYVDLYLIHWPVKLRKEAPISMFKPEEEDFLPLDMKSTWKGMEQCLEMGFAKAIGVSNFSSKKIEDLLSHAKIPPAVDQVEMHPQWQQKKLRDYCSKHNIHVSAWSPLGAPNTTWGSNLVMDDPFIHEISQKLC
ncbi:non-functional NADPH-dependent codeinone reductase 2-like isoform X2 [Cryptomeria japonica]|uniref:non-functional NADPH-dependent codeinone reductase 2-like isoform X2 n=1 Tax=Cryptomeria japonica TaxID=3369 RepID=UPI0027DA26B6|nr:non-functional NADPH-dependent codeinone reductase 2-like isoform X2 [Cryptomeria japonica]